MLPKVQPAHKCLTIRYAEESLGAGVKPAAQPSPVASKTMTLAQESRAACSTTVSTESLLIGAADSSASDTQFARGLGIWF